MLTDQDLRYHKGQEFTKNLAPHIHCVILSFSPADRSYIVDYTCSGHLKKVPEHVLVEHYTLSSSKQKKETMATLCEVAGVAGYADEDGVIEPKAH